MRPLIASIGRLRSWLTWPALAAVGVAAFATSLHVSAVRPAQGKVEALQRTLSELRAQYPLNDPASRQNPHLQLVRFYESFPSLASAPNWLKQLYRAAQSNHLELMRGDYRILRKEHGQLSQYQMTLPLKGSYPNIRGFLNTVLSEFPGISLDNVAFERQKIGEADVQVSVRLTLYLRDGP